MEWLCEGANGFFVSNRNTELGENESALRYIQQIVKEFGDLLHAISGGLNEDPFVKGKEAQRIRKEWEDLKRAGEACGIAVERRAEMYCGTDEDL